MLVGAREPTFKIAPDCHTNAAAEAIDFMRSYGRPGDPWQCDNLELWCGERRDGTWAAFECFLWVQRQCGKGWDLEARELTGLFVWAERLITHTAHRVKTVLDHYRRLHALVDGSDDLTRRVKRMDRPESIASHGHKSIELMSGARLDCRVRSGGGGGRGESGEVMVFDEALYLKAQDLESLGPTMLAMPDAQVIYTSTPPESADAHIVKVRQRAHDGEPRIAGAEWSNPPRTDVDDEEARARVNPAYGIRITPERMEDMRGMLGEAGFARECIGIWPDDKTRKWVLIPQMAWEGQLRPTSTITGPLVLALATQRPERSWTCVAACGRNGEGERHIEWSEYRVGTKWAVPWLKQRMLLHRPLVVVVDDRELADEAKAAGLTVYRPTAGDAVTSSLGLLSGLADPDPAARDIVHIGQGELTDAAAGAVKRSIGDLWAIDRRDPTVEVSPLVAGAYAAWALVTPRIHTVVREVKVAAVDTGPRPKPADPEVDVGAQRLLEQLERDLAAREAAK